MRGAAASLQISMPFDGRISESLDGSSQSTWYLMDRHPGRSTGCERPRIELEATATDCGDPYLAACGFTHVRLRIRSRWSDSGGAERSDIYTGQDQKATCHQSDTNRLVIEPG
jgi:hypothetical protein